MKNQYIVSLILIVLSLPTVSFARKDSNKFLCEHGIDAYLHHSAIEAELFLSSCYEGSLKGNSKKSKKQRQEALFYLTVASVNMQPVFRSPEFQKKLKKHIEDFSADTDTLDMLVPKKKRIEITKMTLQELKFRQSTLQMWIDRISDLETKSGLSSRQREKLQESKKKIQEQHAKIPGLIRNYSRMASGKDVKAKEYVEWMKDVMAARYVADESIMDLIYEASTVPEPASSDSEGSAVSE